MSYILDALRRADAERRRGAVPTLHAQPAALDPDEAEPALAARRWVRLVAGATGVLVLILAFLLLREAPQPAAPAVDKQAAATMQAPAPIAERPSPSPATSTPKSRTGSRQDAAPDSPPTAVPAGSAAAEPEPRVLSLSELPEEVRRGLPALAVTGTMYSDNPANRMVVINGRLLRENDPLSPELTLEQIRRQSVVLRYLGHRFEVANP